jgi:hypothetical protein
VFDALVVIQQHDFEKFVKLQFVRDSLPAVYMMLTISSLVSWFLVVAKLEVRLVESYEARKTHLTKTGVWILILSGVLACTLMFFSVAPFAYQVQ